MKTTFRIILPIFYCVILLSSFASPVHAQARIEESENFYLTFQSESGTVIAASVSEKHSYIGVRIHVQYKSCCSRTYSEKVIVKGIAINSLQYQLETVFIDERLTGSRIEYNYRINDLFDEDIRSVKITIVEQLPAGEKEYTLDLTNQDRQLKNISAIVRGEEGGNVYATPSSAIHPIGKLFAGTKLTVYFTTDDGWAAIGVGSRDSEAWGYMKVDELCIGETGVYTAISRIRQLSCENSYYAYEDVECTQILCEIQADNWLDILGYFGDVYFIKTGCQYGYVPTDIVNNCSLDLPYGHPFVYHTDVRHALLKLTLDLGSTYEYKVSADIEYTPKYTVNDHIESIAVYINGDDRYILSAANDYSVHALLEEQLTSLVLVPIWASGGELTEDSIVVPIFN